MITSQVSRSGYRCIRKVPELLKMKNFTNICAHSSYVGHHFNSPRINYIVNCSTL